MRRYRRARAKLCAPCLVMPIALGLLGGGRAAADATPDAQAVATTLFREAKELLDAGKVAAACRKLEQSHRLYPAGGILLNLAVCHEREGRTASAWAEFREARIIAERVRRDDRVALADEHLRALEPRLSKLEIRVSPEADVPGIEVMADRTVVPRATWGTLFPVDPGDHLIEASAPGRKRIAMHVTVRPEADMKTVVVAAWQQETPAAAAPPIATPPPPGKPPVPERTVDRPSPPRTRNPAIVAGTIGLGGIVAGSYFGIRAISKHAQSNDACTTNPCSSTSMALNDSSKTAADVSTTAFAIGLVGLGVGAYLWFSTGDASAPPRTVRIAPTIGSGRGTVDVTGTF